MNFNDLDKKLRVFETLNDQYVLPQMHLVARIDGRNFTALTKEKHNFETPFDSKFRDMMTSTVEHLMQCGFKIVYGYTQSDEISLLIDINDNTFERKLRKINSILAGEASAKFSLLLGDVAVFDCRISQLPSTQLVMDYFRWRNEDAHRNALNAHCYWALRKEGLTPIKSDAELVNKTVAEKNDLLFQRGINFNNLPAWQKRGMGVFWEEYEKEGYNPKIQKTVAAKRRRLKIEYELPLREEYSKFVNSLIMN